MVSLTEAINTWIESHPKLKGHYKASLWQERAKDPNYPFTIRGYIISSCDNGDGAVADVCSDFIRAGGNVVRAAEPTFFEQLEKYLVMRHDRTREGNVIMWRSACEEVLHDCKVGKPFCSC